MHCLGCFNFQLIQPSVWSKIIHDFKVQFGISLMWCKLPWLLPNCSKPGFLDPFFFYKSYLPSSSCAWFSSVWCSSSSFFSLLLPSDEARDVEWTPSGCCSHWVFVHLQAVCQQRSTFAGQEEYLGITNIIILRCSLPIKKYCRQVGNVAGLDTNAGQLATGLQK